MKLAEISQTYDPISDVRAKSQQNFDGLLKQIRGVVAISPQEVKLALLELLAYPSHDSQCLRRDSTCAADRRFLQTPSEFAGWLFQLAEQATDGAVKEFDKVERIVKSLRRDGGTFIPYGSQEATGTAQL